MNKRVSVAICGLAAVWLSGCYALHSSDGGGQKVAPTARQVDPSDVRMPAGFRATVVAEHLTFPTGVAFDEQDRPCVVESGYAYGEVWATPRLLRIEPDGKTSVIATGARNGPWTGVAYDQGTFYVAEGGELEGGRILRITPAGEVRVLLEHLPSLGDHHTDGPVIGPDGWLYFGQGTASNSGVVGPDNAKFGWLQRQPAFHDIPGQDIELTDANFDSTDVLHDPNAHVKTGAFQPFGTPSKQGQKIPGQVPCSGGIMRIRLTGGAPELVSWGFRNPFGLAFSPDRQLYATDNGYDDRGSRPIWAAPDVLWKVQSGVWYGWPDFSAGQPLNQSRFRAPRELGPDFLLAKHPNIPPLPVAKFGVHSSADGLDFSRNPAFGYVGEAFVAEWGDAAPVSGKVMHPVGYRVVRVNVQTGVIEPFAENRSDQDGPASKLGLKGLERPVAVRFNRSGTALYVVDFGIVTNDTQGSHPKQQTGVVWRITKG